MSPFDENPNGLQEQKPPALQPAEESSTAAAQAILLTGDPISYAAMAPAQVFPPAETLPEDLRISWSWAHFLVFLLFGVASQFAIAVVVLGYFSTLQHVTAAQLQALVTSNPKVIVGTNVLWFGLIMLFLYVTLSVLRGRPFWRSLGWTKLDSDPVTGKGRPWMYFLSGCGLAIFVAVASSQIKNTGHLPIQDLFQSRTGALLLMAMAVFVAPLVEETVFRGYLYPLFAGKFSALAKALGVAPSSAIRFGTVAGIVLTGTLFGLLHGTQLGWNWRFVALLTLAGVIFTFARAWTGTVLASFMLHLGYNSMIAATSIIATKGFTHLPPVH
jgi:membrane protease YdiL (CAAX protease family)